MSPIEETSLVFMRVGEPGRGWDNNQFTALVSMHVPEQIPLQLLLLQLLEVAGIPKKNY